jgi:hypothetical protein
LAPNKPLNVLTILSIPKIVFEKKAFRHIGFVFDLLQPYLASVDLHLGAPYHASSRAVATHDRPDNLSLSHP